MGLIILLVAVILAVLILPIAFVWAIAASFYRVSFVGGLRRMNELCYQIAISIDQLGNTTGKELFDDTLILAHDPNATKFGDPDETISSVLGKNKLSNTLTNTGKALDWILNKIDPNHSIKSIENFPISKK